MFSVLKFNIAAVCSAQFRNFTAARGIRHIFRTFAILNISSQYEERIKTTRGSIWGGNAVAEDEHGGLIRVTDMLKIYNSGQAVCSLAHIRRTADQINLFAAVIEHENSPLLLSYGGV